MEKREVGGMDIRSGRTQTQVKERRGITGGNTGMNSFFPSFRSR